MKIARNLLKKTYADTYGEVTVSPRRCLEDMQSYLRSVLEHHVKKDYLANPDYLIGAVYKENGVLNTDNEVRAYCKCQLSLAVHWFDRLLDDMCSRSGQIRKKQILSVGEHLHDFMHDIKPIIEFLERQHDPDFVFFNGGKAYGRPSWQIYRESYSLYWSSSNNWPSVSHRNGLSLSVFTLRQSLEILFQRVLGFYGAYDKNNREPKIRHDFFPEYMEKNIDKFTTRYTSLRNIIKVYKWTNFYVHTGVMPRVWEAWFALEYCKDLFQPPPPSNTGGWSIHGAIEVVELDWLRSQLLIDICDNYGSGPWCVEFGKPEAVIRG